MVANPLGGKMIKYCFVYLLFCMRFLTETQHIHVLLAHLWLKKSISYLSLSWSWFLRITTLFWFIVKFISVNTCKVNLFQSFFCKVEHAVILFLVGKDSWCFIIKRSWNRGQCAYKGKINSTVTFLDYMWCLCWNLTSKQFVLRCNLHLLKQTRNNMFSIFWK